MNAQQQLNNLLADLAIPYWTPLPTSRYLTNWQGNIAQFNVYYVLRGRFSSHHTGDLAKHQEYWKFAGVLCNIQSNSGPLAETILVASPVELFDHVIQAEAIKFSKYMPLMEWHRLLNETQQDSKPLDIELARAQLAKQANKQR